MNIAEKLLYYWSKNTKSPISHHQDFLGNTPGSDQYGLNYSLYLQYDKCVRDGLDIRIRDKKVLEIGCGHGGISIFCAINGAEDVLGIDIDDKRLKYAEKSAHHICNNIGIKRDNLPLTFSLMSAYDMNLPNDSVDLILADNVFEHFMNPELVLEQCYKVLTPGGRIVIRSMPSIYSKYGLHLKNGLKVPWANLFFSEKTICKVMHRLGEENPNLIRIYPGLKSKPLKVRDLRYSNDLNGITYKKFLNISMAAGFHIEMARPISTPRYLGHLINKLPFASNMLLWDVFSTSFKADLIKLDK